jgi:predicted transposase YbfD/YdcC
MKEMGYPHQKKEDKRLEKPDARITTHFEKIEDPRIERTKLHKLIDIIVIAICAVICGAEDWVAIEEFGKSKEKWFKQFLEMPNGIPSHDTFGRVFARIDGEQFQKSFIEWVQAISWVTQGQVMAVDGKELRRSHDQTLGKSAIEMVSVWACENRLVLGQQKVDEKSNEITAIPELLNLLEITGCIVTIDALGCQTKIAETIADNGGDYILALKENQGQLYEDVELAFKDALQNGWRGVEHDYHKTVDKNHGRIEIRQCWTISGADYIRHLRNANNWKNLCTIVMVISDRYVGDERTTKTRYFISSLDNDARRILWAKRAHWQVENSLHWVLDVAFSEDYSRVRKGNAAQNFAIIRHIALNLLRQETSLKIGVKNKRLKAAWDENYLLKVLLG